MSHFLTQLGFDPRAPYPMTVTMDNPTPSSDPVRPSTDPIAKELNKFQCGDRVRWSYEGCAQIEGTVRTVTWSWHEEVYKYQLTLDDGYQAAAGFNEDTLELVT
jgi:hypothetical protein